MSKGDRWDRLVPAGDKSGRQTKMDLLLYFTAQRLIEDKPIEEPVRLALAESLLQIGNGKDPRDVFGPIKGKRKTVSDRFATMGRDRKMAYQVHYLLERTDHAHGSYADVCEYVAKLHRKGQRVVEAAYTAHREDAEGYWNICKAFEDTEYLPEADIKTLHVFLQNFTR